MGHRIAAPDGRIRAGAPIAGWKGGLMSVRDRDLPANCGYKADKILETPQPEQPPAMSDVAAPLTASEKITLRRIALGSTSPRGLPEDQVSRLQRLNLIQAVGSGYQLTPQGKAFYETLPRPMSWTADLSPTVAIEQMLSEVVQSVKERKRKSRRQQQALRD